MRVRPFHLYCIVYASYCFSVSYVLVPKFSHRLCVLVLAHDILLSTKIFATNYFALFYSIKSFATHETSLMHYYCPRIHIQRQRKPQLISLSILTTGVLTIFVYQGGYDLQVSSLT
jgi:hypothetical protein